MALKFLNKKGWHTGSLRNIENVWKAEQKHEAEQKKLEELKKQIHDEREAQEFRHLQEQAGLVPKQERLEFLYNSGLAVGKSSTDEYLLGKPIDDTSKEENEVAKAAAAPGSLFVEDRPHSANDAWRKIHSDPLLLIRQQEQAALARIRNNPVKMEMIKTSVKEKLSMKEERRRHKHEKQQKAKNSKRKKFRSDSFERSSDSAGTHTRERDYGRRKRRDLNHNSKEECNEPTTEKKLRRLINDKELKVWEHGKHDTSPHRKRHDSPDSFEKEKLKRKEKKESFRSSSEDVRKSVRGSEEHVIKHSFTEKYIDLNHREPAFVANVNQSKQQPRYQISKLSVKEKAARLKEMQIDAEAHEEQRWHRLKKASDADALEEAKKSVSHGRNFLDLTARDVYGPEKGGSASVEESVKRRTHFIDRSLGDSNINTFQR